ncbi:MAG: Rieske (2Fe-2S) protein [Pseudomonadota bacterium]
MALPTAHRVIDNPGQASVDQVMRYEYVPPYPGSGIDHVGTYKRKLPVSLDRMYENALDWEHLPYLHGSSFGEIECLDAGAWGWRAAVKTSGGEPSVIELSLDRSARRWITRTLEGRFEGAEIWTHVFVTAPHEMDIVIYFFVPGIADEAKPKIGRAYAASYEQLYDEDVFMMSERQRQLDRRVDSVREGAAIVFSAQDLASLPQAFELNGRGYFLQRHQDRWVTYPQACPHQLGPLPGEVDAHGQVSCPWHGYRFDVHTGRCVTGASCRFGQVPEVLERDDGVEVVLR